MGKRRYSRAEHQKAWEIWYETRNKSEVSRKIGCDIQTAYRWSQADFHCVDGCPFHGWEALLEKRDAALSARFTKLQQGIVDPVELELAMTEAADEPGVMVTTTRFGNGPALQAAMSDLERLGLWTFLFRKIFFDLTGIALTPQQLEDKTQQELLEGAIREAYEKGLHATNAESAIRMLKVCEDQMDKLQGADHVRISVENTTQNRTSINIEKLMILHEKIEQSPEQILDTTHRVTRTDTAA